ncbi:MAG TPA: CPCC family cysteine-rich protein [Candidatus Dormibacteraeota bacterium]|nr:CPCC family cysteine-rich protein [Candidatus Dormibacteraeota bacterium]
MLDDDPRLSDEELLAQRRAWFEFYARQRNVFAPKAEVKYTCPCCGHRTLDERGAYEICPECGWEDDGQDDHDSSVVRGGPNGRLSLDDAREEYVAPGRVRLPHSPPALPR